MLFLPVGPVDVAAAKNYVGAPSGHVGGHGYRAQASGLGHDSRFLLVDLGVQDLVGNSPSLQAVTELLRGFDGGGANQYRLPLFVQLRNGVGRALPFGLLVLKDQVRRFMTNQGDIGRNHGYV